MERVTKKCGWLGDCSIMEGFLQGDLRKIVSGETWIINCDVYSLV